tara:strand:+ start:1352 stop:2086 length:735 start_codon:yes stop_codon:yes gene_type:complete
MKHLKGFNYIKENNRFNHLTVEEFVKKILDISPSEYEIRGDDAIESFETVYLDGMSLVKIPFKFSTVFSGFHCNNNKLTSLKNSPYSCAWFDCSDNELTNLKYSPDEVMESYVCHYNKLTTLKFGPGIVNGDYYVTNSKTLETLDTSTEVGGKLIVSDNNIYNLDEFDCKVKSSIYIMGNPISKLLGITTITKEDQDVFIDRIKKIVKGKKVNLNQLKLFYRINDKQIRKDLESYVSSIGYFVD